MLIFSQPVWLALLIPLGIVWALWPMPTRLLRGLRAVVLAALVLAMAQPAIKLPDRAGTVVVVADRSDSMPAGAGAAAKEAVDLIQRGMGARDQLAVVSFGQQVAVEQPPQRGEFPGFTAQVGADASNLADALDSALALIPPDAPGRILVVSDGKWTGRDPLAAAARAAGRGIAMDHRLLARPSVNDLAIQSFQTPETVLPGQAYIMTAWVQSPVEQTIEYQLARGATVIASGKKEIPAGRSRLLFRDRATTPGTTQYQLSVKSDAADPVPENNLARALVGVRGPKPILVLSSTKESGYVQLLRRGRVDLEARTPAETRWTLEELARYSGVVLENVLASQVGSAGMEMLSAWVETTGSGLMITGGRKSYGPGGYFGSPLDRILPVSMEMRKEHRKLQLAIVVVLDRSGSMSAPAGGGKKKIDLANIGTVQVLDLLGPTDELGVIAVDSRPHTMVELAPVDSVRGQRSRILSIESMGGGIFIYEGLAAGSQMVMKAKAETKHIILFADAADSEEPGQYQALLEKTREAGITVSVIGMGTEADVDANLLKDIAARGGGQIYFSNTPEEFPRIFAQDTFTVARSTFIEDATPLKVTGGFSTLGGQGDWQPPALGGYNLTYLKPEANLALVTQDEYAAPVVAAWQVGSGRALAFTGEADGKYAGDLAKWGNVGDFHATLARWTAGEQPTLPDNMLLTQEVRDGACFVQLHLDPERTNEPFATPPRVKVLHGLPGAPPAKLTLPMQWKSADLLEAVVALRGSETALNTVEIPGLNALSLPPVCLLYSPEFAPEQAGRGRVTLEKLSATTSGEARVDLPGIWKALPTKPQFVDLAVWLVLSALLVYLAEIFERRTGWLGRLFGKKSAPENVQVATPDSEAATSSKRPASAFDQIVFRRKQKAIASAGTPSEARPDTAPAASEASRSPEAAPADQLEALRLARKRAQERRGKE